MIVCCTQFHWNSLWFKFSSSVNFQIWMQFTVHDHQAEKLACCNFVEAFAWNALKKLETWRSFEFKENSKRNSSKFHQVCKNFLQSLNRFMKVLKLKSTFAELLSSTLIKTCQVKKLLCKISSKLYSRNFVQSFLVWQFCSLWAFKFAFAIKSIQ